MHEVRRNISGRGYHKLHMITYYTQGRQGARARHCAGAAGAARGVHRPGGPGLPPPSSLHRRQPSTGSPGSSGHCKLPDSPVVTAPRPCCRACGGGVGGAVPVQWGGNTAAGGSGAPCVRETVWSGLQQPAGLAGLDPRAGPALRRAGGHRHLRGGLGGTSSRAQVISLY